MLAALPSGQGLLSANQPQHRLRPFVRIVASNELDPKNTDSYAISSLSRADDSNAFSYRSSSSKRRNMPRILAIGSSSVSRTPLSLPPLGPEAGQTQEPF